MKSVVIVPIVMISLVHTFEADASKVWTMIGESARPHAFGSLWDTASLKSERLDDQFDSELAPTLDASRATEN